MGYNDSKEWLDEQDETIRSLIEIAKARGVSHVEFDSSREALYYQQYISNVKHGLQIHYPNLADVATAIRTWRDNDYDNGRFVVHVGIPAGNYNRTRKGKSNRHRRLPPPTVQGRPPVPVRGQSWLANKGITPTSEMAEDAVVDIPDTLEYDELLTDDNMLEDMPRVMNAADMGNYQLVCLNKAQLSTQAAQTLLESLKETWTLDDFTKDSGDGTYTSLKLRRLSHG